MVEIGERNTLGLCHAGTSRLVVVDAQPRLAAAMPDEVRASVTANLALLLDAARMLDLPVSVTEQYPKGLGHTEASVAGRFPDHTRIFEKTSFSCCGADGFVASLDIEHQHQLVIAGMESHVCVLQSALDLRQRGFQVFVVEDAVCSRNPRNHRNAMERLRHADVLVTNTESVLFEWLRDAGHQQFKAVSALLK